MSDEKDVQYLSHISNEELAKRAELSDDEWIELPEHITISELFTIKEFSGGNNENGL